MGNEKEAIKNLLGEDQPKTWSTKKKIVAGVVTVAIISTFSWWMGSKDAGPRYLTESVSKGNLVVNVTANGTLEAEREVTIGSELSGFVENVLVDVIDTIKRGQALIDLDTATLQANGLNAKQGQACDQGK